MYIIDENVFKNDFLVSRKIFNLIYMYSDNSSIIFICLFMKGK